MDRIFGRRVCVPEFEIVSCPTISLNSIKQRRFGEESIEMLEDRITASNNIKEFIFDYIKYHKEFDNFKIALRNVNIKYIEIFNKLIILK